MKMSRLLPINSLGALNLLMFLTYRILYYLPHLSEKSSSSFFCGPVWINLIATNKCSFECLIILILQTFYFLKLHSHQNRKQELNRFTNLRLLF